MYILAKDGITRIEIRHIKHEFLKSDDPRLNEIGEFMTKCLGKDRSRFHLSEKENVCACGKKFIPSGNNQKFHSAKCRKKYQAKKNHQRYLEKKAELAKLRKQKREKIAEMALASTPKETTFQERAKRHHSAEDNPFI